MPTLIKPAVIDTTQPISFANVSANTVTVNVGVRANGTFGTAGQVLTSNGTASHWANASSGGISAGKAIALSMVFR